MLSVVLAPGGLPGQPLPVPHVHARRPAGVHPPLRPSPWHRVTRGKSSKLPGGGFAGKQKTLPVLPNRKWQGMLASPLSDTLSAPNPDMRRQLGAGIPFPRQQMGHGNAPWGWGAAAEGLARSGSAS